MKHLTRFILGVTIILLSFTIAPLPSGAGGMSNWLENKAVDYIFRVQSFVQPSTLCVALATSAPSDTTTGATLAEASYTGYARGQLDASYSNWKGTGGETTNTTSSGVNGTISNASAITIGSAATSGPTVVTHYAILDSCTVGAGNILFYATLTASKTINNGDPAPQFAIDALTIQIDN